MERDNDRQMNGPFREDETRREETTRAARPGSEASKCDGEALELFEP